MKDRIEFIFDEVAKDALHKGKDIEAIKEVLETCGIEGRSVLEAGCGMGDNLFYCIQKGARYAEGFDISGESIRAARAKAESFPNLAFYKTRLEEYTPGRRFDLILALGVFEYVEDPLASLKKLSGFLSEEGALILLISKPIFIKRISFLGRRGLSLVPLRYILPVATLLSKVLQVFNLGFKKMLYAGKCSTYTLRQTILEGLMVPRYNVFHHGAFCRYLHNAGFSIQIFYGVAPSMICLVAKKGQGRKTDML